MVAQARRAFFRTVSKFGYSAGQIVPLSPGVFRRKQVSKHSFLSRRGLRGASNLNRSNNSPEQNPRGLGFYTWPMHSETGGFLSIESELQRATFPLGSRLNPFCLRRLSHSRGPPSPLSLYLYARLTGSRRVFLISSILSLPSAARLSFRPTTSSASTVVW